MNLSRESLQKFLSESVANLQKGDSPGSEYLKARGVESWQVKQYSIGWVPEDRWLFSGDRLAKVPAGSLTFPLHTPYLGYAGLVYRLVEERAFGHVVVPGTEAFPRFMASWEDVEQVFLTRSVVLVEGPFDKLALSLVFPNVLSVVTSVLSRAQGAYLSPLVDAVACIFDMDIEGERGWDDLPKKLGEGPDCFRVRLPYKDPSKCLTEMGKRKFVSYMKDLVESLLFVV